MKRAELNYHPNAKELVHGVPFCSVDIGSFAIKNLIEIGEHLRVVGVLVLVDLQGIIESDPINAVVLD